MQGVRRRAFLGDPNNMINTASSSGPCDHSQMGSVVASRVGTPASMMCARLTLSSFATSTAL